MAFLLFFFLKFCISVDTRGMNSTKFLFFFFFWIWRYIHVRYGMQGKTVLQDKTATQLTKERVWGGKLFWKNFFF